MDINITLFQQQLKDALFVLNWKIDGQFVHCIKPNTHLSIKKEWVVKNYNIRTPELGCSIGKVYYKE